MAGESQAVRQAVRQLAGNSMTWCYIATVISVDKSKNTCTVEPLNGDAEISDVRLNSEESSKKGIVVYPKKDSVVMVTMLDKMNGFISLYSEIEEVNIQASEKITLNGDSFGGLIKIEKLKEELEKITIFLQTLQTSFAAAAITPGDGGATLKTSIVTAIQTLQLPNYSQIENDKIKHGNS